jgi:nitrate/nitrite-specific signal transduction histidine kinase
MQLKYRITLAYTLIVTVILLLLCAAIYFFSEQNRRDQFQHRLKSRALSTAHLLTMKEFDMADIKRISQTTPSVLKKRSTYVLDDDDKVIYQDNSDNAPPVTVTYEMLKYARAAKTYYFKIGDRDGIAMAHADGKHDFVIIVAALDEETNEWLEKLRLILLICLISSILLVIFSGYFFSVRVVRAITKLKLKIDRISSEHFSQRLDTGSGKDELQKLAITVNDLLDRLQLSFDTQRRFIENASHELSTPLTAIYSQLEIALQKERSPEEYRKALISLKTDVKRLNLLLRSLLEIAKASGSEGGIELSTVRIDELLNLHSISMAMSLYFLLHSRI